MSRSGHCGRGRAVWETWWGRGAQSVVPRQIVPKASKSKQTVKARIWMIRDTWKERETQRQEEQRPPIRVWSVCVET